MLIRASAGAPQGDRGLDLSLRQARGLGIRAVSPGNTLAVTRHHESGPRGFGGAPICRGVNLWPPVSGQSGTLPGGRGKHLVIREHRPPNADQFMGRDHLNLARGEASLPKAVRQGQKIRICWR